MTIQADSCELIVADNGLGLDSGQIREGGLGLANIRRRAEKLRGSFDAVSSPGGGTTLTWRVPIHD